MNRWVGVVVGVAVVTLGATHAVALSVQEAILRAKPAVALVTARVGAEVTMDCGQGPVTVTPSPFVETGTGWFIDGRGYLITNAHVVDPVHRLPPWVLHELKKKAIEQACVEPALKAQGLMRGQRPEVEDRIRRQTPATGALATAKLKPVPTAHRPALERHEARGRGEEVQRAHSSRQSPASRRPTRGATWPCCA